MELIAFSVFQRNVKNGPPDPIRPYIQICSRFSKGPPLDDWWDARRGERGVRRGAEFAGQLGELIGANLRSFPAWLCSLVGIIWVDPESIWQAAGRPPDRYGTTSGRISWSTADRTICVCFSVSQFLFGTAVCTPQTCARPSVASWRGDTTLRIYCWAIQSTCFELVFGRYYF